MVIKLVLSKALKKIMSGIIVIIMIVSSLTGLSIKFSAETLKTMYSSALTTTGSGFNAKLPTTLNIRSKAGKSGTIIGFHSLPRRSQCIYRKRDDVDGTEGKSNLQ